MTKTLSALILDELERDPRRTAREVAETVGCSEPLIRSVAAKHGILYGQSLQAYERAGVYVPVPPELREWLWKTARRRGVSREAYIAGLVIMAAEGDL